MTSVERGVERVAHVRVDGIAWRIPERITTTGERVCRAWDGEHRRQLSPRPEMLENVPAGAGMGRGWKADRAGAPIASRGRVHARAPWPLCKHERGGRRRGGEARRTRCCTSSPSSPAIIFTRSRARVTIARESLNNPPIHSTERRKRVRS